MKPRDKVFCSLDQPWKEFSKTWGDVRRKPSEKSIHGLRVNTRRLRETLEFARALSDTKDVRNLMKRLKKLLKRTSALRDLQVQLETAVSLPRSDVIAGFTRHLKRLERKRIRKVETQFKRREKQQLTSSFKDVRSEFMRLQRTSGKLQRHDSARQILAARRKEFLEAKQRFDESQPRSEKALHEMRIALKKLRYAMEAAHDLPTNGKREQIETMRAFQKLLGDTRDLEILRVELEHWANKKGKTLTVIPALQELEEKRQVLLDKLLEASQNLSRSINPSTARADISMIA
jgi:CHAD domain-containing protein